MEDIKKEKNIHMYFMVSIVLAMFMEIYAFLMRLNLLNIFIFISFIFYLWNQNHKKKQMNYLIQCCDAIIEQKDFSIIDGESKESLLSNKLYVLNKRYHQSLEAVKKEQLKLKDYIEDISHQLKTPITSIRIQTELLLEENQNKKLYSIEHQIQRIGGAFRCDTLYGIQYDGPPPPGRIHRYHQAAVRRAGDLSGGIFLRTGICPAGTGNAIRKETPKGYSS